MNTITRAEIEGYIVYAFEHNSLLGMIDLMTLHPDISQWVRMVIEELKDIVSHLEYRERIWTYIQTDFDKDTVTFRVMIDDRITGSETPIVDTLIVYHPYLLFEGE